MAKVKKTIEVSKSADIFSQAIISIAVTAMREYKDNGGWDTADDMPPIVLKTVAEVPKMIAQFGELGPDFKEDAYSFSLAWAAAGQSLYEEIKKESPKVAEVAKTAKKPADTKEK